MPEDYTVAQASAIIMQAAANGAKQLGPEDSPAEVLIVLQLPRALECLLREIQLGREALGRRAVAVPPDPKPQPRRPVPARAAEPVTEGGAP